MFGKETRKWYKLLFFLFKKIYNETSFGEIICNTLITVFELVLFKSDVIKKGSEKKPGWNV